LVFTVARLVVCFVQKVPVLFERRVIIFRNLLDKVTGAAPLDRLRSFSLTTAGLSINFTVASIDSAVAVVSASMALWFRDAP
jgi:hypothetical protein